MKFSEQWLREWVNPGIGTDELLEQLTMAGLEVDSVVPVAGDFSGVCVAEVIEVSGHPDAKKLHVCRVSSGDKELPIVCGAANVRAGLHVPLAREGARMPNGMEIRETQLRGVTSLGMLCSGAELGLEENSDGLMELPEDAPLGMDLREYLGLEDRVIEVDLTPNRGDCLSIAGVAREIGVLNRCPLTPPVLEAVSPTCEASLDLDVEAPDACPHYAGRVIQGVNAAAVTPMWLRERLRRGGIRSINIIVDITNYVMLELGQPMHAFDLARLDGGIRVRMASKGESITLLDGQQLELDEDTLVIADQSRALALAGIMGGEDGGVSVNTTDIFLESAFFNPLGLAGEARRYRLHTDSSHRFERGVDFALQVQALERASTLILECCGGQAGPVNEFEDPERLPRREPVPLRRERLSRLLGCDIDPRIVTDVLRRLELGGRETATGWEVLPPSFRFDIEIEADLIEEIARIIGYSNIPEQMPGAGASITPEVEERLPLSLLRQRLVERGYQEAISYSFVDPALQSLISPDEQGVALANPISADMSVMRTSLWPGLLQALRANHSRQQARTRLFETGLIFTGTGAGLRQQRMIAGAIYGDPWPEQWGQPQRMADFFDLKADVEGLCGPGRRIHFEVAEHPALHPGQCARVEIAGRNAGLLGALHPAIAGELDFSCPVYLFQLELEVICKNSLPAFLPVSRFPSIRRDLALVVDESVAAGELLESLRNEAPEVLKDLQLFDVYQGEGVDSGKKSLALGLIFQGSSSTLIEEDVEKVISELLTAVKNRFGATLRE